MEVSEIFGSIRRHWLVAVLTFIACWTIGVAAAYYPAKHYQASTVLGVSSDVTVTDPTALAGYLQVELPQLAVIAQSAGVEQLARNSLPVDLRAIPASVTAKADPTTLTLAIRVNGTDPAAVAPLSDAVANTLRAGSSLPPRIQLFVISPAAPPGGPTSSPLPLLAAAAVFGLIAAAFAAVGAAALRRRRDSADEIRRRFGTGLIAEIPRFARTMAKPRSMFGPEGPPEVVEAFYRLRANIELIYLAQRPPAIVFTSCGLGEGKSTVTAHLAWALAASGHPVSVIDCDLRWPTMHQLLDVPLSDGVSESTDIRVRKIRHPAAVAGLQVIPAGVPDRHPTEIISAALPRLLEDRSSSEWLLIDAPPLTGAAEAPLVAAIAGAAVLVLDARRHHREDIERALLQFREAGVVVVGVVLNRVRIPRFRRAAETAYLVPRPLTPRAGYGPGGGGDRADGTGDNDGGLAHLERPAPTAPTTGW